MKKYFYMIVALLTCSFWSCSSDEPIEELEESPFSFEMEYYSHPDSISFYYSSPDPGCGIPKSYRIHITAREGELQMNCTNYDSIYIDEKNSFIGTDNRLPLYYAPKYYGLTAEIENGNILKITFEEPKNTTPSCLPYIISISADTPEGKINDMINILRFF